MLQKAKQYNFFTKIYNRIADEINSLWKGVDELKEKQGDKVKVWWDSIDDNKVICNNSVRINMNNNMITFSTSYSSATVAASVILQTSAQNQIIVGDFGYNHGIIFNTNKTVYFILTYNAQIAVTNGTNNITPFSYSDFVTLKTMINNYNSQNA